MATTPPTRDLLAANLKALRDASGGLSQDAIAKRAGMDQKGVSRALSNSNETGVGKLDGLAKAFGVQPWHLVCPGLTFYRGADQRMQVLGMPSWPFTEELWTRVSALGPAERLKAENTLRVHLDLPTIAPATAEPTQPKLTGTHG